MQPNGRWMLSHAESDRLMSCTSSITEMILWHSGLYLFVVWRRQLILDQSGGQLLTSFLESLAMGQGGSERLSVED